MILYPFVLVFVLSVLLYYRSYGPLEGLKMGLPGRQSATLSILVKVSRFYTRAKG